MLNKPFKSPLLIRKPSDLQRTPSAVTESSAPPSKRRRISHDNHAVSSQPPQAPAAARKPLLHVVNPAPTQAAPNPETSATGGYYTVLWRKPTAKKNKTWDGDGLLEVAGGYAYLHDENGKDMGKTMWKAPLLPGSTLSVAGKDVEVDAVITKQDFHARRPSAATAPASVRRSSNPLPAVKKEGRAATVQVKQEPLQAKQVAVAQSRPAPTKFKTPLLASTAVLKPTNTSVPQPRHDPNVPGALVMKRPLPMDVPKGKQVVDVVVDPLLSKHLREHQRQGVQFLYDCVMGMGSFNGRGAILADEMGLGKTLQTIALIWTLLKQNPIHEESPVVKKALVVCPAGVVGNWRKEFRKWLGNERIGVFVADDSSKRLTDFTRGKCYQVMIIGYERLQKSYEDITKRCTVDLVVLDEGHKLKTLKSKSAQAIRSLGTDRIIMLSGTPFSNNMLEFFSVADLVNPGALGKLNAFKREFEGPIVRGQQPDATAKEKQKGAERSEELEKLKNEFLLRRTADILAKYLPPKTEHVLLCRPTSAQAQVYRAVLASPAFSAVLGNNENALQLINILKQVCNSPKLLLSSPEKEILNPTVKAIVEGIPSKLLRSAGASAKLQVLDSLLHRIRTTTKEKVVIVSHYTSTLDILGGLLNALSYPFLRVDGQTPANKRQQTINKFNASDAQTCFAFLLSAKAGGVGINLVGASRLVLYDIDWNPAHDLQAMARIHRDGQARPCRIYRLLTMGALDEKIYQRQLTKQGLADSVIDNKASASSFTRDELRDLFSLGDEGAGCQTHALIGCPCGGRGNGGGGLVTAAEEDGLTSTDIVDTDEEDDDSLPELPTLLRASQVNMDEQERRLKEARCALPDKKAKMMALMQYAHVDTALITAKPASRAATTTKTTTTAARAGAGDGETPDDADRPMEAEAEAGGGLVVDDDDDDDAAVDFEALIDDEALLDVIREEGSRVRFVFSKTTS